MLKVLAWFDAPKVLDCSVTNIPGSASAPVQVVASLAYPVSSIQTATDLDQYIGVYSGGVGQEVLEAVVGGVSPILTNAYLPAGTRISLRNMSAAAITSGSIMCQFIGNTPVYTREGGYT